jgi:hypothetical protein
MSQLNDDDRLAVDWLLDRRNGSLSGNGGAGEAAAPGQYGNRIGAAQSLLQLLDLLPGGDPPEDLLARTLRRIEGGAPTVPSGDRAAADPDRPLA